MKIDKEKKKLGRPNSGIGATKHVQIMVTPDQHAWLMAQDNASATVRRLIDEAMKAEQAMQA